MGQEIISKNLALLTRMIDQITANKNITVVKIRDGFVLDIPITYRPDEGRRDCNRKQFVYVTTNRESPDGGDLFQVFTICAPDEERFYRSALILNMNIPFGAIAISNVDGINYFVLVDTYLVEEVSVHELEASIHTLACCGDRIEEVLIGVDLC